MLHGVDLRPGYARSIIFILLFVMALLVGAAIWQQDLLHAVYLSNHLTPVGLVVNACILALFLLGLARLIYILLRIGREEHALARLTRNLHDKVEHPMDGVSDQSWAGQRVIQVQEISDRSGSIDQAPLAAALVANQNRLLSFPRFVQNILILVGVFGTIVSLALALLGASDLLNGDIAGDGMGKVIHGMSTALSTTITAIVCYVFYAYFVVRTTDAQSRLVAALESVSAQYLLPRFSVEKDSIMHELAGLVSALKSTAEQMRKTQSHSQVLIHRLSETTDELKKRLGGFSNDIADIRDYLRRGFRLPDDE